MKRRFRLRSAAAILAVCGLAWMPGSPAHAQNTIGGDTFAPGEADFPQSGPAVGRGPGFQFSDWFYEANGIDADELRAQEFDPVNGVFRNAPSRLNAWYRGNNVSPPDAGVVPGVPSDDRFIPDTRIVVHNMGFNAAGEMLFYPDPPAFFFESAFLNQETKDLANGSFVFIFPRAVAGANTTPNCGGNATAFDFLDPAPCNRRQDNIFDTGNGYLTDNPLQLWRIVFVNWDGPDVNTPQCQAKMAELAARNGLDSDGTPLFKRVREILDVASGDLVAGQGANEVVLPGALPGAHGLPNPDPRGDIPNVEPEELGQVCVTVRTRRQELNGVPAKSHDDPSTAWDDRLDGPPFVV